MRLEMSLGEEKSSNAVLKQELQQRASKEKSLRDKDSIEAMQRFNSLQQTYKLLQTEHQDRSAGGMQEAGEAGFGGHQPTGVDAS